MFDDGHSGGRKPLPDAIRAQLAKVVGSNTFAHAASLRRLLQYVVEESLVGHARDLKEYRVGVEALGRPNSFDPETDPIVRVQARRLRGKLEEYYRQEGRSDVLAINLPKGAYVPTFEERSAGPPTPTLHSRRKVAALAASLAAGTAAGGWLLFRANRTRAGNAVAGGYGSIAVLPLVNLSGDPSRDFFADGLTEALITNLSKIRSLRVLSRTSAMTYKNAAKKVAQIAREVNVDAVVEGSVNVSGNRVRIVVQLIDAASDRHLWAETYDREAADALQLQSEVARSVAASIRANLTTPEIESLAAAPRLHPDALEPYLQARYQASQSTGAALNKSIDLYQRAIALDPGYAPAHSGQAFSYIFLCGRELPPHSGMPKAKAASLRAIELDERLAEAHAALGWVHLQYEWDWRAAEDRIRKSLGLNPSSPVAHQLMALYLIMRGEHQKAIAEALLALELDPLSLMSHAYLQLIYFAARDFRRVIDLGLRVLERNPKHAAGHLMLALAYEKSGRVREAMEHFRTASRLDENGYLAMSLAHGYALVGSKDQARRLLERMVELSKRRYICAFEVAAVYVALGEADPAFEWFGKAVADRSECLVWAKVSPWLDPVRSDPRFATLLQQVGFEI